MSKKITVQVDNEAIFKDKNYVPYISRHEARRKGIKRDVQPVHAMEPHIRAMTPTNTLLGNRTQIHIRGTNSPYNKKGRLVRREYHNTLKSNMVKAVKKFITDFGIVTKINKRSAKPHMIISHRLPEPIVRNSGIQRFVSMVFTEDMFKKTIRRSI